MNIIFLRNSAWGKRSSRVLARGAEQEKFWGDSRIGNEIDWQDFTNFRECKKRVPAGSPPLPNQVSLNWIFGVSEESIQRVAKTKPDTQNLPGRSCGVVNNTLQIVLEKTPAFVGTEPQERHGLGSFFKLTRKYLWNIFYLLFYVFDSRKHREGFFRA